MSVREEEEIADSSLLTAGYFHIRSTPAEATAIRTFDCLEALDLLTALAEARALGGSGVVTGRTEALSCSVGLERSTILLDIASSTATERTDRLSLYRWKASDSLGDLARNDDTTSQSAFGVSRDSKMAQIDSRGILSAQQGRKTFLTTLAACRFFVPGILHLHRPDMSSSSPSASTPTECAIFSRSVPSAPRPPAPGYSFPAFFGAGNHSISKITELSLLRLVVLRYTQSSGPHRMSSACRPVNSDTILQRFSSFSPSSSLPPPPSPPRYIVHFTAARTTFPKPFPQRHHSHFAVPPLPIAVFGVLADAGGQGNGRTNAAGLTMDEKRSRRWRRPSVSPPAPRTSPPPYSSRLVLLPFPSTLCTDVSFSSSRSLVDEAEWGTGTGIRDCRATEDGWWKPDAGEPTKTLQMKVEAKAMVPAGSEQEASVV
ncbi:hypothetical protein R3P38DRAFT_2800536 [Favolaschia claudopus]|uniref:Uncharacterized protein n=1 Tax=Favolaschia claudopus TaxID=2862362 RepID=A0AAV9ZWZ4_9AGAR